MLGYTMLCVVNTSYVHSDRKQMDSKDVKEKRKIDFDEMLIILGSFGKFQIIILCLACLCDMTALQMYASVFLAYRHNSYCLTPVIAEFEHNCSLSDLMQYSIPLVPDGAGKKDLDHCSMYVVNSTEDLTCNGMLNVSLKEYASVKDCEKWNYDTSVYKNSIVKEVRLTV